MNTPTGLPTAPPVAPTPQDEADRQAFDALVDKSLEATGTSAQAWQTRLAALVTLATTALLISGPTNASDLPPATRPLVIVLLAGGLGLTLIGLWKAEAAASGIAHIITYRELRQQSGSVQAYQVSLAQTAAGHLTKARRIVAVALTLFVFGMVVWWLTPTASPRITITTATGNICGRLDSADQQTFKISIPGESTPRTITYPDTQNIRIVDTCD